jgi:CheY-like chemotaxis protein
MSSTPTIYFIDDSATMREVIKIAFRRENINVVACHDAAQALVEIESTKPDIVITDVIMPEKDGYDVCQYIKNHPDLAKIPVVLMSGVVNRAVAEKAFAVRADELLRKPFQPQDLIARVKHLLKPNGAPAPTPAAAASAAVALSSIFSAAAPVPPRSAPAAAAAPRAAVAGSEPFTPVSAPAAPTPNPFIAAPPAATMAPSSPALFPVSPGVSAPATLLEPPPAPARVTPSAPPVPAQSVPKPGPSLAAVGPVPVAKSAGGNDVAKLKVEVLRLEGLVKKLQAELQAEREYARALEAHVKTLQQG